MTEIEDIQKALDSSFVAFGTANAIPTILENIDYNPTTSQPYLSSYLLMDPIDQADLGYSERTGGIYQIDVNYRKGSGTTSLNKMADLLRSHFKVGANLSRGGICVKITGLTPQRELTVGGGWAKRPVDVEFFTYLARA